MHKCAHVGFFVTDCMLHAFRGLQGQKRVSDPLDLGVVVSCPAWVLGTELHSPGRAASEH